MLVFEKEKKNKSDNNNKQQQQQNAQKETISENLIHE